MLELSKHNILAPVPGSDRWILANLLSGEADLLEAHVGETLAKGCVPDAEALAKKGYLVDPAEEALRYQRAHEAFVQGHAQDEVQLFYAPSYACNFGCSYCFQDEYAPATLQDTDAVLDAFFATIDDAFKGRKKYVTLFGGEPLLSTAGARHVVERMIEGTTARGLDLAVVTNGYSLRGYVPLLATGRIREIQVTLDGTREMHDRRRALKGGGSTFDQVVQGIDACLAANLQVNLRTVVDKENLEDFASLAHFAIAKGWTKHPKFKTQVGRNYELHHCQVQNTRLYTRLSLWQDMHRLIEKDPAVLKFYRPSFSVAKFLFDEGRLPDPLFDSCPATKTEFAFDATGTIYPCTANVGKAGEAIGTFYPQRRFDAAEVAAWSKRDVTTIPACASCSQQLACGGGCGAVSKNQAGTVNAPDCRPVKELLGIGCAVYGKAALEPAKQEASHV